MALSRVSGTLQSTCTNANAMEPTDLTFLQGWSCCDAAMLPLQYDSPRPCGTPWSQLADPPALPHPLCRESRRVATFGLPINAFGRHSLHFGCIVLPRFVLTCSPVSSQKLKLSKPCPIPASFFPTGRDIYTRSSWRPARQSLGGHGKIRVGWTSCPKV